jgi:hypothetical protein
MSLVNNLSRVAEELKSLQAVNPERAMDQIEVLVESLSVKELAQTLRAVYADVTRGLGIDWHFTALQWKVGNSSAQEFFVAFPKARFTVWSLPFVDESDNTFAKRYATCLPFQFQSEA